jgi:glycerophosphoryl diester phosphodiesterase
MRKIITAGVVAGVTLAGLPGTAHAQATPRPKKSQLRLVSLPQRFFTAHRGDGSFLAPENTEAAMKAGAANPDVDLLEFDVHALTDGKGGIWHDTTLDRISTSTGKVTDLDSTAFKKLTIDAHTWFGGTATDSHPMLLNELLDEFAGKKLLLAHPKDTAAMHLVIDEVTQRNLTDSVLVQTSSRADAALAHQAGLFAQVIIMNTAQSATDTPQAIIADGIPRVSLWAGISDTVIATYVQAGLIVSAWDVQSHDRRDQLFATGVRGIDADDPTYIRGNTTRYHRTTDPFRTQNWWPGHLSQTQNPNTLNPAQRGTFTTPAWWTIKPSSTGLYARQGWATLTPSYNLRTWIRFDTLSTDKTRWAGLYLSSVHDQRYNDAPTDPVNAGYTLVLRQNGQLQLYRKEPTRTVLLKTITTPAVKTGTIAKLSIRVTPTTIYFRRYDTTVAATTVKDTKYRGTYLYLGRSATTGHPGPGISISNTAFF